MDEYDKRKKLDAVYARLRELLPQAQADELVALVGGVADAYWQSGVDSGVFEENQRMAYADYE